MSGVSNIDKYQLGPEVRNLNLQYPSNPAKIAEEINKKHKDDGVKVNRFNVRRWIKKASLPVTNGEVVAELSKELMVKDKEEAIAYHNEMFEAERKAIRIILENDEVPEHVKLNQIQKVYNGSLGRTLDSFGYGKQPAASVNIQMNFIQDKMREIAKVIVEECNGDSDRIIKRLELLSSTN